jgi:hypothetical protein
METATIAVIAIKTQTADSAKYDQSTKGSLVAYDELTGSPAIVLQ